MRLHQSPMAFIVLAWMGCVDTVDFDTKAPMGLPLIIDGSLTNGDTAQVILSKSYPVDGGYHAISIPDAQVWITSPDDPILHWDLVPSSNETYGTRYRANDLLDVVEGYRYQLHVRRQGGQYFMSTLQQATGAGNIDSIYFEFVSGFNREKDVEEDGFNVYVDSSLPSGGKWYLRWKMNGTYQLQTVVDCVGCPWICWVSEQEDKPLLSRSTYVGGNTLRRTFIKYIPINIQTFSNRYHVEVVQQAITEEAWEFYDAVRNQLVNASSLFQPAISSPIGNIRSVGGNARVLGIFTASRVARKSIFIKASDVPYKVWGTPPFGPCNHLPNTTTVQPPFWN